MKAYSFFAKVYDVFMNDIPYVDWLDGIEAYMERRNIQCHRVLELGCGTGRFTALLAADGYEVTGLDLSEAMIKVAKKKPFGKRISYVCSDMRNFNLGKKFDVVISVCDSMNYLLNNDDMYNTFLSVGKHLEKGGFFIFDLKTETFYEKLGNNILNKVTGNIAKQIGRQSASSQLGGGAEAEGFNKTLSSLDINVLPKFIVYVVIFMSLVLLVSLIISSFNTLRRNPKELLIDNK